MKKNADFLFLQFRRVYIFPLLFLTLGNLQLAFPQATSLIHIPETGSKTLLNSGWYARRANEIRVDGNQFTTQPFNSEGWMKAKVPGTVLTTMLENNLFPAPELSLNNNLIPDIYTVGKDFYTFWFVRPFEVKGLIKEKN
ncbi:MAG: beta-glycosidase, partial [Tannerella sp.]|nr:beta-glycosidase [Tannerella sp.]